MHISQRRDGDTKKKRKKEKVVSLRMSEDSFDTIEEYASRQGLSVNAYINSIVDSYAQWYIPGISLERVAVPKKLLATLFDAADKNTLEKLGQYWAHEAKNTIFLTGSEFSLESAIDYVKKASKYFVKTSPTITVMKSETDVSEVSHDSDREGKDLDNDILMVVRHDMGNNFSIFVSQFLLHFFRQLESRKVTEDHDSTTNFVRLEKLK
jgi:predicted DNA binding CopG/RHH family protein